MITIPDTAVCFANLQKLPGWSKQSTLANPDPSIAPNPPADCELIASPPGNPNALLFYVAGQPGKYCGWLSAMKKPYLPGLSHAALAFTLALDPRVPKEAQALEFDFLVSRSGYNYLFGFQVLPQQGNQLQISNAAAGWQPVFPGPQSFDPATTHLFNLAYQWDEVAHTFNFLEVDIDGAACPIPAAQNPQTASNPKWSDTLIVQVQQGTKPDGGSYWFTVDQMHLFVW